MLAVLWSRFVLTREKDNIYWWTTDNSRHPLIAPMQSHAWINNAMHLINNGYILQQCDRVAQKMINCVGNFWKDDQLCWKLLKRRSTTLETFEKMNCVGRSPLVSMKLLSCNPSYTRQNQQTSYCNTSNALYWKAKQCKNSKQCKTLGNNAKNTIHWRSIHSMEACKSIAYNFPDLHCMQQSLNFKVMQNLISVSSVHSECRRIKCIAVCLIIVRHCCLMLCSCVVVLLWVCCLCAVVVFSCVLGCFVFCCVMYCCCVLSFCLLLCFVFLYSSQLCRVMKLSRAASSPSPLLRDWRGAKRGWGWQLVASTCVGSSLPALQ